MIDDNDTTNATTMMLNYSMNITNYTPHHEPSPHRPCQDPLDRTRRSLHRHRCRSRPPLPSLSATAAIVTIMGLVVFLRRLPPTPSSSFLSNAAATPPTKESPQSCPRSPPPLRSSPSLSPSRPLCPLDRPWRHLGWQAASTPSGTTRRVPIQPVPPLLKDRPIMPAPPSRPPRCLGLLSGGRS